jgi:hypothetical protein
MSHCLLRRVSALVALLVVMLFDEDRLHMTYYGPASGRQFNLIYQQLPAVWFVRAGDGSPGIGLSTSALVETGGFDNVSRGERNAILVVLPYT